MKTLKQEIKVLKVGHEKIFKVDHEAEYITVRKSKLKGLEIVINDDCGDYEVSYEEIRNNFTNFSLYNETEIDY